LRLRINAVSIDTGLGAIFDMAVGDKCRKAIIIPF
jgi:hypothetical protein